MAESLIQTIDPLRRWRTTPATGRNRRQSFFIGLFAIWSGLITLSAFAAIGLTQTWWMLVLIPLWVADRIYKSWRGR